MAQYFSGQHGQILIKPQDGVTPEKKTISEFQQVGSLRDWQMSMSMGVLDTTTMERTDRTLLHGVRSYNGSATMLYYRENDPTTTTSNVKRIIQNTFFQGDKDQTNPYASTFGKNPVPEYAVLKLRLHDGGTGDFDLECVCLITSFAIQCAVGDVVSASISFEGTGLPINMNMIA